MHPPTFNPRGGYLAFLGRISPEKGVDRAIKVARTVGIPLKIATVRDQAIVYDDIASVADLPKGWSDEQSGGRYRRRSNRLTRSSNGSFIVRDF